MSGTIDILACHAGHTTIKFDKTDPIELDRTRRLIKQMLRMGCILFIESGNTQIRVHDFDESCDCYIVADVPQLEGLGDAVIPVSTGRPIAKPVETNPPSNEEAGEVPIGASNAPLSGQPADSDPSSTVGEGVAPAADSEDGKGKEKRGRGRPRKVDASKVNTTVVPIQSGG